MSDERREAIGKVLDAHVARILMINSRGMCKHGCSAACATKPCEAWPSRPNAIAVAREHSADRILALMDTPEEPVAVRGAEHPYYCAMQNFYSNDAYTEFESWADFVDEMGGMDLDLNHVFRWDWRTGDDWIEDGECEELQLAMMHQRKGRYWPIVVKITPEDEPAVRAYLERHWRTVQANWAPISRAHPPRAEGEVIEGWVEEGMNDDTELCGDSWREWIFVESNRPAPDGARRARLIIEQEESDV